MKAILITALVAAALAGAATAATFDVGIANGGWTPSTLTVEIGDTVRWTNRVTPPPPPPGRVLPPRPRTVVSREGLFAPAVLDPGQSFSHTFEQPGFFTFTGAVGGGTTAWVLVRAPTLSLTVADAVVAFGAATHVTGVVSTRRAGEHVTVLQRPYGEVDAAAVAEVTTGEGGAYDVAVTPTIQTAYTATYRGVLSAETTVAVRPAVKLTPGGRGTFLVRVGAGALGPARPVSLQRRAADGRWVDVARTRLGPALTATFRIPRVRGVLRYRAFVPSTSGYAEGWSGTQTVRTR